jgi:hypothetical protein
VNTDELLAQMQREDLEGATKLTPVDYGKLRGIAPQLVYYHIRAKHITTMRCDCGRKVIDVDEADEHFKKGKYAEQGEGDEAPSES